MKLTLGNLPELVQRAKATAAVAIQRCHPPRILGSSSSLVPFNIAVQAYVKLTGAQFSLGLHAAPQHATLKKSAAACAMDLRA
jgi:hypothetical protein